MNTTIGLYIGTGELLKSKSSNSYFETFNLDVWIQMQQMNFSIFFTTYFKDDDSYRFKYHRGEMSERVENYPGYQRVEIWGKNSAQENIKLMTQTIRDAIVTRLQSAISFQISPEYPKALRGHLTFEIQRDKQLMQFIEEFSITCEARLIKNALNQSSDGNRINKI